MARDRDWRRVARRTLREGKEAQAALRIADAWDNYVAAGAQLAAIHRNPCPSVWPPSLSDLGPTSCDLIAGHDTIHRHRIQGTQSVVTW